MRDYSLTVTELNEYVRKSLAGDPMLRNICITGEISNFKNHFTGHWYFTLKDEESAINCAMYHSANIKVGFLPKNGQKVRVMGNVGLYTKTGSYQFYADYMEEGGLGELYVRFEKLKRKLEAEGYFDASIKKPLPMLPKGIGIATSETGAVIHDIMQVSWRRFPGFPLYLFPVKVQGDGAAAEIASAIHLLDSFPLIDVIIIGRGGGSMEDLWAFNEECVARAIHACRKPIVSAVGHETDFTIADFTADVRASTPSVAAEITVPRLADLTGLLETRQLHMENLCRNKISEKALMLSQLQKRLLLLSPEGRKEQLFAKLRELSSRIQSLFESQLKEKQRKLESTVIKLTATGPMQTLRRGYTILTDDMGNHISKTSQVCVGQNIVLHLTDGKINADVKNIVTFDEPIP